MSPAVRDIVVFSPGPRDVGYDIYLLVGQSNGRGEGLNFDATIDVAHSRIKQYTLASGTAAVGTNTGALGSGASVPANTIMVALDPLYHPAFVGDPATGKIGHAMSLVRAMLPVTPSYRTALIVPVCTSGSGFAAGQWQASTSQAQICVTAASGGVAGNTAVIGGVTLTIVASGATGNQVNVAADAAGLAVNFKAWVDANVGSLTFTALSISGADVILGANASGAAGNSVACSRTGASFVFGNAASGNFNGGTTGAGVYYTQAVTGANAAIAAAGANARLAGIIWHQGEADSTMTPARRQVLVEAMIDGLRAAITGAANAPFIAMGMIPEYIATVPYLLGHEGVHALLPSRKAYCGYAPCPTGSNSVPLGEAVFHIDAVTQRKLGVLGAAALLRARGNYASGRPPGPFPNFAGASGSSLGSVVLTWDFPLAPASRFTSIALQYRKVGASTWVSITPSVTAQAYTVTGLDLASIYEFQISGANESGAGAWAPSITVTTQSIPYLVDDLSLSLNIFASLRKGRVAYAGKCIRVRRSSDDAETDIDFDVNGLVSTSALLTHCGAGSGYVVTAYNQMGTGNDPTQATKASQPRIVNTGVVVTANGFPTIDFYDDGSHAMFLASAGGFPVAADVTMACAISIANVGGTMHIIGPAAGGNHALMLDHRLSMFVGAILAQETASLAGGSFSIAASYTASTKTARVFRGGTLAPGTINPGSNSTATVGAGFQWGTYQGLYALQYKGQSPEMMIGSTAMSDALLAQIAAAHRVTWGTA